VERLSEFDSMEDKLDLEALKKVKSIALKLF